MCKCNGKLVDHLLLHCLVATDLWSMVLGFFGVSSSLLARLVWSSSKWSHMNSSPLFDVVSLEKKK